MSDFEKMKELFMEMEINHSIYINDGFDIPNKVYGHCIKINEGEHGYGGFYAVFHFDNSGKFISHGIFE